ncbi:MULTISPECIES: hypothetical protein [Dethiosulfovibrio]|jgi:hypothetical protein|uniref:Uncharacterized protein n=2 Tax=Dethiosulfovibrio TaxID=47054 RepID=A0ABS9EKZ2_9BACT|nr:MULTISPECIES: hypothetical protein [Dethiosulfovibrio]MCF4113762.1 hypothetical protein [Dethiosulfovibrio russensis]MCF4141825.1 hypothetical protein [Dethiosulfovibrio marinus]MCF4143757.1 hypothetical protein [Dethiosulfovibrio acidaminovorans]
MDMFIDGVPFSILHMESLSREELLDVVLEELAGRGLVLKEIVSHGEALSEESFLSIPDGVEVYFLSDTKEGIVDKIILEFKESVDRCISVAEGWMSRRSDIPDKNSMERWVESMEWIVEVMSELNDLGEKGPLFPDVESFRLELGRWSTISVESPERTVPELEETVFKLDLLRDKLEDLESLRRNLSEGEEVVKGDDV